MDKSTETNHKIPGPSFEKINTGEALAFVNKDGKLQTEILKEKGLKYDGGKPKWHLLPFGPIKEIVKVLTFGATKYAENNWQKVDNPIARYFSACMRHIDAWKEGEKFDPETGIHHFAHAACNLVFLLWFELKEVIKPINKEGTCEDCLYSSNALGLLCPGYRIEDGTTRCRNWQKK